MEDVANESGGSAEGGIAMIRHLVRLTWNRKRATALIMFEILVCFLVLTVVTTGGAYYWANWRQPLGFSYHDVLHVQIGTERYHGAPAADKEAILARLRQVHAEAANLPEVESAAMANNTPYSMATWSTTMVLEGRDKDVHLGVATIELKDALRLTVEQGRWFEEGDATQSWVPVVINRKLARARFGDADPLGQPLDPNREPETGEREMRVIGVITDLRRNGELAASPFLGILPARLNDVEESPPTNLLLLLRPGTGAVFEERLLKVLNRVAPEWSFNVNSLAAHRQTILRMYLIPLLVLALVAGFLFLMVALGLVGVLWQNVTRRTSELGLRRALGGTAGAVRAQIMGELLVLTTFALAIGTLVIIQFPMLGVFPFLTLGVYAAGLAAALLLVYAVVTIASLYPSWLATRIHPGPALQHE